MNEIVNSSAVWLRDSIRQRALSCVEVIEAFIAQIEKVNDRVNAIVTTTFEQAIETARAYDQKSQKEGVLFGLPIAHKDLARTRGIRTTFGSVLYQSHIPSEDDLFVKRIKRAGAICLGKTNTPEFGAGSHTFNRVFGATRNPYDLDRSCGGSSGGAAVALATRMLPIADGGDFGGSLRNPAAFCNVIGFRPTIGRVPNSELGSNKTEIPTLGPMARSIDDVALLFSVMAGPTRLGTHMLGTPGEEFASVEAADLRKLRIAFTPNFGFLPVENGIRNVLEEFVKTVESYGASITEASPELTEAVNTFQTLRAVQFRKRFEHLTAEQKLELKDTILWNLDKGMDVTEVEYTGALQKQQEISAKVSEFFQTFDLLIGPTTQVLPFPLEVEWVKEVQGVEMQNYIDWMSACTCISVVGSPALSLPAGFSNELPVGAQLIAPFAQDKRLLSMAKAIEQVTHFAETPPANVL